MSNILIISDAYWDDPYWASRHYIAKYLSKEHEIIFVEKATTLISPIFYDVPWTKLLKGLRLKKVGENISVYSPLPRFPFDRRYRIISRVNQSVLAFELNLFLKRMRIRNPHIITFDYKASVLIKKIKSSGKKCYYVVDEISKFKWPLATIEAVLREEVDTIEVADLVVATSLPLKKKCLRHNYNVNLISHGVDLEIFNNQGGTPEDILAIKRPIAGFVGKIEDWVDLRLVEQIADMLKNISFVFIGPKLSAVEILENKLNIWLLGPRKREYIPSYLKYFDCGIIPFKKHGLAQSVNPLKMYEYLAAGLPVVSTPMKAVEGKEELGVYVEDSVNGFAKRINEVITSDIYEKKVARVCYARNNSWKTRANEVMKLLEAKG